MKGIAVRTYFFFVICLASASVSLAQTQKPVTPESKLQELFPKLPYKQVSKTDIPGLYEVLVADGRIFYFYPNPGYLFVGDIINKEGRSVTRERMAEEKFKSISAADLAKGIKIGNGKNVVVEVTDPDCPFCRKMHAYWSTRNDVTRYVFLKPLDIHKEALRKSKYIFSASDRDKALFEVYCGKFDNKIEQLKFSENKEAFEAQKAVVDKLQVSGTPSYWVNGKFVSGANIPQIESIIGKAEMSSAAASHSYGSCKD